MNVKQLCQKYNVYIKEDIQPAWQKFVTEVEEPDVWDYNAAMLEFLNHYFVVKAKKENELANGEDKAVERLVIWINAYLKRGGDPVRVSAKKKTRQDAVVAACRKLDWELYMDFPTDISITQLPNGKFQCDVCGNILFSPQAGEITMKLLDKDRFTNYFLTAGYAAKCGNITAYYRIGRNLARSDQTNANRIASCLRDFNFSQLNVEVKNDDNSTTTYTLYIDSPLYWYYLGAEAGGDFSTYEAAIGFRRKNIHTLSTKYMYSLATYNNDHRAEAEVAVLEALATQRIPNSIVNQRQRSDLINRLVDKYASSAYGNLSKPALKLLANQAYSLKKYRVALDYYHRAGIKFPNDTTDAGLQDRMGNLLFELGEYDAALAWLEKSYLRNALANGGKMEAPKLAKIYLQRWGKRHDPSDAKNAKKYLELFIPTPEEMAILLQMHVRKDIELKRNDLKKYARSALRVLDAKTAGELGYELWKDDKTSEEELYVDLMRRATEQDRSNGLYWYNLGRMVGYNTLYGEGFSAQKLNLAKQYFETARNCGFITATLPLSDCYWSTQKPEYPQDYQTAKELLQTVLTDGTAELRYHAYLRLASIGRQEKKSADEIIGNLAKAHGENSMGSAVTRFQRYYGQWIGDYVDVLKTEGTLQREMERIFCGNAEFLYAIAMQQELAGAYRCSILLYGCSAAMGNKKALCCLYNMSRIGTNYFTQKEVAQ